MPEQVLASGNLASVRRMATSLLVQLEFFDVAESPARQILSAAGLPPRVLDEPDFPISLTQELQVCLSLIQHLGRDTHPVTTLFAHVGELGIEMMGVLGMAMLHADTLADSLAVCLRFPQLTPGHSRMVISRQGDALVYRYTFNAPEIAGVSEEERESLAAYCLSIDLLASLRNMQDVAGQQRAPHYIHLPFPQPPDWSHAEQAVGCPVLFDQPEAGMALPLPAGLELPGARRVMHRYYVTLAEKLSQFVEDDASLSERVTRWIWAYCPPLNRSEVAAQLAMSERTLNRRLAREGSSYAELLATVQADRAMNYLRNLQLSVGDIGHRLGYSEPAAFTRAFTHWVGKSPLQWRKESRARP